MKYIVHTINNIVRDIHLKMCSTQMRALFPVLDEKGGGLGGVVEMMVSCSRYFTFEFYTYYIILLSNVLNV